MKIKGTIEDLKFKKKKKERMIVKIVKNLSRTVSGVIVGSVGVSSFSDSSLFRLIFLKIYRPLPV